MNHNSLFIDCEHELDRDLFEENTLSYDVASGIDITPGNKIDKPLVAYRFSENVMTSITTLRTLMTKV